MESISLYKQGSNNFWDYDEIIFWLNWLKLGDDYENI